MTGAGVDEAAGGLTLPVPPELLEAIAVRAADLVEDRSREEAEPWIDVEEAAEYMACKPQRIYDLVSQGRMRHRKDGRRLLFRRSWLDAYLEGATAS